MKPALVILAAGAGSRYGGLKQLAPIGPCDETLLEYSAYDALRAGFGRVVLVVRRDHESDFRHRLDGRLASHADVHYAQQSLDDLPPGARLRDSRVKPLGTGHAVLSAAPRIDGPFAVINADDFYGAESFETLARFLVDPTRSPKTLAVVGFEVARTLTDAGPVARALCEVDGNGYLTGIAELGAVWRHDDEILCRDGGGRQRTLAGDRLVSMNMWGFDTCIFEALRFGLGAFLARSGASDEEEFLLPEIIQSLVRSGRARVRVLRGSGVWGGITFQQDRALVADLLADLIERGHYPRELWK